MKERNVFDKGFYWKNYILNMISHMKFSVKKKYIINHF